MKKFTKIHVRKGDQIVVISGDEKGKKGKIMSCQPLKGRVIVEGVAMVTKHQKARGQGMPGGIIHKEAAIYASKVMLICPKCDKPTRAAQMIGKDGAKVRVCKKCGAAIAQ